VPSTRIVEKAREGRVPTIETRSCHVNVHTKRTRLYQFSSKDSISLTMTVPPIAECIAKVKRISHPSNKTPLTELYDLYLASLALLCHLKVDQATLRLAAKSQSPPDANKIPAITAVNQDPKLFHALLSCLKNPPIDEQEAKQTTGSQIHRRTSAGQGINSGLGGRMNSHRSSLPTTGRGFGNNTLSGRKRCLSISDQESKSIKLQQSPMIKAAVSSHFPEIPIRVLAASILTAAFIHLDHWPAPLVHAYAEDSFGQRTWVDDTRCSILVQNLKLCHEGVEEYVADDQALADAAQVAHFYDTLMDQIPDLTETHTTALLPNSYVRNRGMSMDSADPYQAIYRSSSMDSAEFSVIDESDSGSEDDDIVSAAAKMNALEAGESSSSGEEEIEEEGVGKSTHNGSTPIGYMPEAHVAATISYPVMPATVNLERIRHRYVGVNLQRAYEGISKALEERLEIKSKQNSNLLKALPSFTSIPAIRAQTAGQLGQWLQSPALSGPARNLFASTVNHMKHSDPPLNEDMEVIDAILSMQLKSNQLNMHIENVTIIAKKIPTGAVCRHIYLKLLKEELAHIERDPTQAQSEHLQMIGAVNSALEASLSCDGLAAAILTMIADENFHTNKIGRKERNKFIRKIKILIRRVATIFGAKFDGCRLIESLLSFDVGVQSWCAEDEEDKGRIMLECVSLLVPAPFKDRDDSGPLRGKNMRKFTLQQQVDGILSEEITELKKKLRIARKFLINWCCSDYAPLIQAEQNNTANIHEMIIKRTLKSKRGETPAGAGIPDFSSILDGQVERSKEATCPSVIQCVLFMVDPDSREMMTFLYPNGVPQTGDPLWNEEQYRIRQCYDFGADLDDEMLWIVLQSSTDPDRTLDHTLALTVLEHLFECCRSDRKAAMRIADPSIIWEMYKLVEFTPSVRLLPKKDDDSDADESCEGGNGIKSNRCFTNREVPRLAYPGQWWRVTAIGLIMCGGAPETIGDVLCREHPTIRALVKMVVSGRYRFPTVDCNESTREAMKEGEAILRDKESRIAEMLFLPPKPKEKEKTQNGKLPVAFGSRTSARNRSRLERIERQTREKEASDALAATQRRKKMLKTAQKSVMIWNPNETARKPPKECMNLILSVEELFNLANVLQRSVEPDFVLVAIGSTTRGAIERAYDWLIPVVSMLPSIIGRLPASASCFLLLRAYESEGEGNAELRQLSAPLLDHVTKTVSGENGQVDAVAAIDLLVADVADKKPERRRCARKVLQEALSRQNATVTDSSFNAARCTWLHGLLLLEHATFMVAAAIRYISQALKYESGRVLRAELLSLDRFIRFATDHRVEGAWDFPSILCGLISKRIAVFSDAMDRFEDVKSMSIKVIHAEFKGYLSRNRGSDGIPENDLLVGFTPCNVESNTADRIPKKVILPLSLLQSTCVLLSTWKATDLEADSSSKALICELANIMMYPYEAHQELITHDTEDEGAMSAVLIGSGKPAVDVDQWVLLAKSKTDFIARRAALSAPTKFLPRLLLCSGLPHSSLITMIDRLGLLGVNSDDANKVYRDLMMPSATSDWSISHIGGRKELARKLIGRLSAYLKHDNNLALDGISQTFLVWLTETCTYQAPEKPKKRSQRKPKTGNQSPMPSVFSSVASMGSILSGLSRDETMEGIEFEEREVTSALTTFNARKVYVNEYPSADNAGRILGFIRDCIEVIDVEKLETWIAMTLSSRTTFLHAGIVIDKLVELGADARNDLNKVILNWMPRLVSQSPRKPWQAIFNLEWKGSIGDELISRCASSWCESDIRACVLWAFQLPKEDRRNIDLHGLVNFIVMTYTLQIFRIDTFGGSVHFAESLVDQNVNAATSLSLECAHSDPSESINNRNAVPAWLLLLVEAGQKSNKRMSEIISALLDEIGNHPDNTHLKSSVLRLYCLFPTLMNLGNVVLRNILVEGCKQSDWLGWRSPFDAQIGDMVQTMRVSPSQRLVQGIIDLAKCHPLLVLRNIRAMKQVLEDDGLCEGSKNRIGRSRVWGENVNGPVEAILYERKVKVAVQHWGYMFTDPLWVGVIDTLLSIPREVLFPCGLAMGMKELLGTYLKLLLVQSELQNRDKTARLKSRFSDLLGVFEKSEGWNSWLASKDHELSSLGSTRNILIRCGLLTTDQAMLNIRVLP